MILHTGGRRRKVFLTGKGKKDFFSFRHENGHKKTSGIRIDRKLSILVSSDINVEHLRCVFSKIPCSSAGHLGYQCSLTARRSSRLSSEMNGTKKLVISVTDRDERLQPRCSPTSAVENPGPILTELLRCTAGHVNRRSFSPTELFLCNAGHVTQCQPTYRFTVCTDM